MKLNKFNKLIFLTIIIISFTTFSCATKMQTPTLTSLRESDRVKINNVAILVETDQKLDVNLSKSGNRFWVAMLQGSGSCGDIGCIFLPFLVVATAIIEESVRSGMDHSKENEFRSDSSEIDITKSLSENIDKLLKSSNDGFSAVIVDSADPEQLAQRGYDSILHIKLNKIQLNRCPRQMVGGYIYPEEAVKGLGPISSDTSYDEVISKWNSIYPEYNEMIQKDAAHKFLYDTNTVLTSKEENEKNKQMEKRVNAIKPTIDRYGSSHQLRIWIHYNAKITSLSDSKVLWEKEELYYDPECELVKDMKDNPDVVVDMFSRSLIDIATRITKEINYEIK